MHPRPSRHALTLAHVAMLLLAAGTTSLRAQQAHDSTHFTADLRYVSSAGNSSTSTLSLGDKFERIHGPWTFGQDLQVIYGRSDSTTLANFYHITLRAKYASSPRASGLAYVAWERDTPAGLVRRFEEGLGVVYKMLDLPRDKVGIEAGPTLVQERRPPLADRSFAAARLAGTYDHIFAPKTTFEQTAEYLPDISSFGNFQFNSKSVLAVQVSGIVGLAVSYDVHYVNQPAPGRRKADRFFTAGLRVTL